MIARIRRRKKKFAEASVEQVLVESPLRTPPICEYFGSCGGCKWQHVDYSAQLDAKRQRVLDALVHQGGFADVAVEPVLGSEQVYHYRNKMEYSFSAFRWLTSDEIASGNPFDTDFALGMHAPGHYNRVIDLKACYLPDELSIQIVNRVRSLAKECAWTCWNVKTHEGYLRHLVVRTGSRTGEVMVNLVTSSYEPDRLERVSRHLAGAFPRITTLLNTIHRGPAQVAIGEETHVAFGSGVIHDRIGPFVFEISPGAFFQTNTEQAEVLYEVVRSYADLRSTDVVYDLYCGAGTISLFIAPHVRHVVGVELVPDAVKNAYANAEANGISNCTFIAGDLKKVFTRDFVREHGSPDVLIVDPPRSGMHPGVVEQIASLKPQRLIYVSCNPQTQVRDITLLGGLYAIESVQPVDLFPHTDHIENVIKLSLNAGL